MDISVVTLDEEEVREALSAWLSARLERSVQVTSCKQIKSKGGRRFSVNVLVDNDASSDSESPAG